MRYTNLFTIWCFTSTVTAFLDRRYSINTERLYQRKHPSIRARDLDEEFLSTILPRSPAGGASRSQSPNRLTSSRAQNQGEVSRSPSSGSQHTDPNQSRRPARERSRSPTSNHGLVRNQSPVQSDGSTRRTSATRSNASYSSARSRSLGSDFASARSGSLSPMSSISSESSRRRSGSTISSGGTISSGSAFSSSGSDTSISSGPSRYSLGSNGQVPFPYNLLSPTAAIATTTGPAILSKSAPHIDTHAISVPPLGAGEQGQGDLIAISPFKSKISGVAYGGMSAASAHGDTATVHVRTGPSSTARLTTMHSGGTNERHVGPSENVKVRVANNSHGTGPASATVRLLGEGSFGARARNLG